MYANRCWNPESCQKKDLFWEKQLFKIAKLFQNRSAFGLKVRLISRRVFHLAFSLFWKRWILCKSRFVSLFYLWTFKHISSIYLTQYFLLFASFSIRKLVNDLFCFTTVYAPGQTFSLNYTKDITNDVALYSFTEWQEKLRPLSSFWYRMPQVFKLLIKGMRRLKTGRDQACTQNSFPFFIIISLHIWISFPMCFIYLNLFQKFLIARNLVLLCARI